MSASVITSSAAPVRQGAAPAITEAPQVGQGSVDRLIVLNLATSVALFLLMGLAGLAMRAHQAGLLPLDAAQFYVIMTLHGTGMLAAALLGTMTALWYVVQPTLRLDPAPLKMAYILALVAVVCVVVSTLVGSFGAGWTMLYPLPFKGWWPAWSTALFLVGNLVLGLSFGVFCLTLLLQAIRTYGSLAHALALPVALGRAGGHAGQQGHHADADPSMQPAIPPPPVLIATVTSLQGLVIVAGGTVIGFGLLSHLVDPAVRLDPLWAKNITYFFGHNIANITLYLALGMLYAILPHYAGRVWPTTRPVALAWLTVLICVLLAYFHHLYMDFAQPRVLDLAGEGFTYSAVTAALSVTIFGALLLVWRSAFRWTLGSLLLYVGFSGWMIGGIAAAIDAFIPANFRLHNTLWVPGHFHTYFLLGVLPFVFGFLTHLLERASGQETPQRERVLIVAPLLIGGYGLVGTWLLGGLMGLPRRYAEQPPGGAALGTVAVAFVAIIIVSVLLLLREWRRLAGIARLPTEGRALYALGFRRVS